MEEDVVGDPPSKGERSGVKRGRSSLEQEATGEDFPPLMGISKPNKTGLSYRDKLINAGQTNDKDKQNVPTTSQAASRFAVLDNMDDSQDSDEVVPNTVETNVMIAANKTGNDMRVKGDNKKQLQKSLQNIAQLANKGGTGGSFLANAKIKHGPKVVVSDSANTSPDVHNSNKTLAPKHVMANPMKKQNLEPIVIDEMISLPSLCEDWKLTHNEKLSLEEEVTVEEVKAALFGMNPNKSPGIDGFPGGFFQKTWNISGDKLVSLVKSTLSNGEIDDQLNRTLIVLIPKIKKP
ncbi:CNGC5-like protein [Corchorus olitorius]|uniref:CNGC5-like protein n=1 Tax=Corchorus olitorius TaxID=93759 RepID=A0A1R3HQZ8_9ROSI|nr:CNGC5-like protein [Corchorus olitorius]